MKKHIKFSIIMPVYNVERYVSKAIASIISQTYENWELIIINDGSTDNSGTICDTYCNKDNRIKVYHQSNKGVSRSRNRALEKISGDYVGFVDSDDWVEPSWLSEIIKYINNISPDLIINGWIEEYGDDKINNSKKVEIDNLQMNNDEFKNYYISKYIKNQFPGFCWNKIYKKELLKNYKFREDFNIVEDEIFNYNIYKNAQKIITIPDSLYHYRRTGQQSLTTAAKFKYKKDLYDTSRKFYEIVNNFYEDWNIELQQHITHTREQYVSSMYDCIYNVSIYANSISEKMNKIDKVLNDDYFKESLNDWKIISRKNKALKIMCYIGKIKNKYVAYFIIKMIHILCNFKRKNQEYNRKGLKC